MHDTTGDFKVYPRGFLGARLKDRVEQQSRLQENNTGFVPVKVSTFKKPNGVDDYNHAIEALYAAYIKRAPDSTSAEFREKILVTALNAFGTRSFYFWYSSQLKSPVVNDLHRRFLDDTLKFIQEGKRNMPLETWASIVTIANRDGDEEPRTEFANEFFGIPSNGINRYRQNDNLVEVIQSWCSRPNGIEDLLGTLHLLFGTTN